MRAQVSIAPSSASSQRSARSRSLMWRARTPPGSDAAAFFQNLVLSMSPSFRFEQMPHGAERASGDARHLVRTRNASRTLERVQFLGTGELLQVAVFHAVKIGPQCRDYKR